MSRKSLEEITEFAGAVSTAGAAFYPVATGRCTDSDLLELRQAVMEAARAHGYPDVGRGKEKTAFDQAVSKILYEKMNILPSDATSVEVWNFINVRVLPDVVIWRYGRRSIDGSRWEVTEERLYSMKRTTFGRLWWRACLLGPDISQRLAEDESVQLIERPLITGYAPLARAIAIRHLATISVTRRMDLLRDAMKRFTRRLVVVSVFHMSDSQLTELVDDVFRESQEALKAEESRR
ncbi:hypothetical protein HP499_05070 [Paenarthrobacter sp. CM16]|uniref:hypothetical protein n=1 Tax=Paenarthrobacter sp. CM16 TaxID=2738447 RepID=UPI001551C41F|nr:hypothetical protein [Paenarthrobacter sp. CM16]NQD87179.1 hypothetical protein [Paenarthrobacter sp. CM16]